VKSGLIKSLDHPLYQYQPDSVSFISPSASFLKTIYFPLCGIDSDSIKSSISSGLSGDIKIDKNRYLTKPVSCEDLRHSVRNFFCYIPGRGIVALADQRGADVSVEAGMLWHKLNSSHQEIGIQFEALNFVPVEEAHAELMKITVRNVSKETLTFTPTFCLPLFARALANKHDHEHVTSLLHRAEQMEHGVCVKPTMVFDERGHQLNQTVYYVLGIDQNGCPPIGTFPTFDTFYEDGRDEAHPEAVFANHQPVKLSHEELDGKEVVGALRFADETLNSGEIKEYYFVMGIGSGREEMLDVFKRYSSPEGFDQALRGNQDYWTDKSQSIQCLSGDKDFNAWMRWVTVQPILRRIFGCSFLPDHDYGKGGRGWRDIWQDLLSLILIEPKNIRDILINNFAGVRIDGSNATLIGSTPGTFMADRNAITRVWMDHGVWPFMTLLLYINQTGDYDILFEESPYFRDVQMSRTFEKDFFWSSQQGNVLQDKNGKVYTGSILEHVLAQHLVQFFNVGDHNIIRLEDADWNDGLDMARERGESVAFMSVYGGNLLALAELLERLSVQKKVEGLALATELGILLDSLSGETAVDYDNVQAKQKTIFERYFPSVQPEVSGEKVSVAIEDVIRDLRQKGQWIFDQIKKRELVSCELKGRTYQWFNGYYDNKGHRVEGIWDGVVRMTLMGQVFPVMSGLADDEHVEQIIASVDEFLKDERLGGYRLNTDFRIPHYMDLGRAFGFAYGTKENGAFFSHMIVMYAFALYKRGFVRTGYEVVQSIYRMAVDTDRSKIFPGIPEYFDSAGRGRYHYLTGAASWLVLTQLTQVFGVRGDGGDLILDPKLVQEEFDAQACALAQCHFAGKRIEVTYVNAARMDYGSYHIKEAHVNGQPVSADAITGSHVRIERSMIEKESEVVTIEIVLAQK